MAELDKKSSIETLIRCVVVGQSKGAFNIRDAALLYRIVLFLRGKEDKELVEKSAIEALIKAVVISNNKGCFTLEEASVIDSVVSYLEKTDIISVETPEQKQEEKVVEI